MGSQNVIRAGLYFVVIIYNTTKVEVVLLISENNMSLELGLLAVIGYKIICADFFYVLGEDA